MKNSKSETLNSKQYQNPNDRNRKKEKGFENLNFGNWDLFRISDLGFDNMDCHFAFCSLNFKFPSANIFQQISLV